jgi:hypothetical protein
MTGGKREGAGRPPATNPAIKRIAVKVTQAQHKRFIELGASKWLKALLDVVTIPK